jgi:hypothetical protein
VGKHSAADGASVHPIVADALALRTTGPGGVHYADGVRAATESGLGWPAPPPPETAPLGWPGRASTDAGHADVAAAPPVARRGWRRLLGLSRAA